MDAITIDSLEGLTKVSQHILPKLSEEKVVCFFGPMGAGKTTLIKALCKQLKVRDTISSPTYSLVNEYQTEEGETVYHFDFYRINSEEEAYDIGFEEYLYSNSICLIEWPENVANLLPVTYIEVNISVVNEVRTFKIT